MAVGIIHCEYYSIISSKRRILNYECNLHLNCRFWVAMQFSKGMFILSSCSYREDVLLFGATQIAMMDYINWRLYLGGDPIIYSVPDRALRIFCLFVYVAFN